jgi:hypothetical protein
MTSPGGSRRSLSDSDPLSVPAPGVDFHLTQAHEKAKKSMTCFGAHVTLIALDTLQCYSVYIGLWITGCSTDVESPTDWRKCCENSWVYRLFTFLLFQHKRVCVFLRGGTPAACMLRTCVQGGGGEWSLSRGVLAKFAALAWSPSFSSCHLYSSSTCLLLSISELSLVFLASTHIFQEASALHYH